MGFKILVNIFKKFTTTMLGNQPAVIHHAKERTAFLLLILARSRWKNGVQVNVQPSIFFKHHFFLFIVNFEPRYLWKAG